MSYAESLAEKRKNIVCADMLRDVESKFLSGYTKVKICPPSDLRNHVINFFLDKGFTVKTDNKWIDDFDLEGYSMGSYLIKETYVYLPEGD